MAGRSGGELAVRCECALSVGGIGSEVERMEDRNKPEEDGNALQSGID